MTGERHDLVVGQALDERRHRLDRAHPFAHQDQLVLNEEIRLAGERRDLLHAGVAVLAMAAGALLDALGERHLGRARRGDSERAESDERRPEGQRSPCYRIEPQQAHFLPFLPPAAACAPPECEMR